MLVFLEFQRCFSYNRHFTFEYRQSSLLVGVALVSRAAVMIETLDSPRKFIYERVQ